ncbi:MAG: hypothetical protein IPJ34_12795 [Myxococcales bacterium]|nr:hypothetical protein [Myxococcales bacterium]
MARELEERLGIELGARRPHDQSGALTAGLEEDLELADAETPREQRRAEAQAGRAQREHELVERGGALSGGIERLEIDLDGGIGGGDEGGEGGGGLTAREHHEGAALFSEARLRALEREGRDLGHLGEPERLQRLGDERRSREQGAGQGREERGVGRQRAAALARCGALTRDGVRDDPDRDAPPRLRACDLDVGGADRREGAVGHADGEGAELEAAHELHELGDGVRLGARAEISREDELEEKISGGGERARARGAQRFGAPLAGREARDRLDDLRFDGDEPSGLERREREARDARAGLRHRHALAHALAVGLTVERDDARSTALATHERVRVRGGLARSPTVL